jgi:pseudouridine-5'-phosphate glycosidase
MRDGEVRQVLRERLNAIYGAEPTTIIVEELGLRCGAVRADLAVVNGRLKGYEIKSERDTLTRLARQCEVYSKVFDTVTIVVAERHLHGAVDVVPEWWGIDIAGSQ